MAPSRQRHGKMKLTQAQAEKINEILGVSFLDLDCEYDVQLYPNALKDGECPASFLREKPVPVKGRRKSRSLVNIGDSGRAVKLDHIWLVEGFLPREGICRIYGGSFTGKSSIALNLAFAVATGADFCDKPVEASGDVIYVAGEDASGILFRAEAYNKHHGIDDYFPLYLSSAPEDLSNHKNVESFIIEMQDREIRPRLIIIDTLTTCFGDGDENSAKDMNMFLTGLRILRDRFNCCVLFVHLTGYGNKERTGGSRVLHAALDADYIVKKQADLIRLECTKIRNNTTGQNFNASFNIENVVLGHDEDGDPVISGVAVNVDNQMQDFEEEADAIKVGGNNQKLALRMVDKGICISAHELRARLKASGISTNSASRTVRDLLAKGALIETEDGQLEVSNKVTYC